jgi:hypothetical protein
MNKSYRSVYNEALGAWVATSEVTSSRGKKSSSPVAAGVVALVLMLAGAMPASVSAGEFQSTYASAPGGNAVAIGVRAFASGDDSVALGTDAQATGSTSSFAVGRSANAYGASSISVGIMSSAGLNAVALGVNATASGGNSVTLRGNALGMNSAALGVNSFARGTSAFAGGDEADAAGNYSTAVGQLTYAATYAAALGAGARAEGDASTALGVGAITRAASAVALGASAQANAANSVALGAGSVAVRSGGGVEAVSGAAVGVIGDVNVGGRQITGVAGGNQDTDAVNVRQLQTVDGRVTTTNNNLAATTANLSSLTNYINTGTIGLVQQVGGAPGQGQITVGAATGGTSVNMAGTAGPRTVTGVAPGAVNAGSVDAVNGAQLFGVDQRVTNNSNTLNNIANGGGIKYFHTNSTQPDSAATGGESIAVGPNAQAQGATSIAIGTNSVASGTNSLAVGTGNIVSGAKSGAFGDPNVISGAGSYAVGNDNLIPTNNTFVVGNNVNTTGAGDGNVVLGNGSTITAPSGVGYATFATAGFRGCRRR